MTIQAESPARLLPQLLLPYGQKWAERSGNQVLARLLGDQQLVELLERYGGELMASFSPQQQEVQAEVVADSPPSPPPSDDDSSAELLKRISTLEQQQDQVTAIFDLFLEKAQPLARALGCCPDCLIGLPVCPSCLGRSRVGGRAADRSLLSKLIVEPLRASGVDIQLAEIASPATEPERSL